MSRSIRISTLVLTIILVLSAVLLRISTNPDSELETYTKKLSNGISLHNDRVDLLISELNVDSLANPFEYDLLKSYSEQSIGCLIYKNKELVYWSSNKALPFYSEIYGPKQIQQVTVQKNGYYVYERHPLGEDYDLVSLQLVKAAYPIDNNFLRPNFAIDKTIPSSLEVTLTPSDYPVEIEGKALFYLDGVISGLAKWKSNLILILYLLIILGGCIVLNLFFLLWRDKIGLVPGFLVLIGVVILGRWLTLYFDVAGIFEHFEMFKYRDFQTLGVSKSIADLLINVFLLFWLAILFVVYFPNKLGLKEEWSKILLAIGYYNLLFIVMFLIDNVGRNLILKSNVSFDLNKIFSLSSLSFVGILAIILMNFILFLVAYKLSRQIKSLQLSNKTQYAIWAIGLVFFSVVWSTGFFCSFSLSLIFLGFVLFFLFELFLKNYSNYQFEWIAIWLFFFSVLTYVLLNSYKEESLFENKIKFASHLLTENHSKNERYLTQLVETIKTDKFIQRHIDPLLMSYGNSDKQIKSKVNYHFQAENYLLNHFDIKSVKVFDVFQLKPENFLDFQAQDSVFNQLPGTAVTTSEVKFYMTPLKEKNYTCRVPIVSSKGIKGVVFIQLNYKDQKVSTLYPELLMSDTLKQEVELEQFDYALIEQGQLIKKKFSGDKYDISIPTVDEGARASSAKGYNYLFYPYGKDDVAIISSPMESWVNRFSLFSYLFCLFLLVLSLMIALNNSFKLFPVINQLSFIKNSSLKGRVQISIVAMILLSFLAIAFVTVYYFKHSSEKYHTKRLERKTQAVSKSVDYLLKDYTSGRTFPDVAALSTIHKLDVDMYNRSGRLISSSQENIYKKGLMASLLNPAAIRNLRQVDLTILNESIGDLSYKSAYIKMKKGQDVIGFLGLPYYSKQTNLRDDTTDFISALLNVYVLLLLVAGFITVVVANSITKPLSIISAKLKELQLGKKNEPIEWGSDDELGQLIAQYNRMIQEIELSAERLAHTEREFAWREMAKQVAHEIKNPLTPMKLNIQQLQRMAASDPEAAMQRLKSVSASLIGQIDSLANIASEFSNFAKMPIAENEKIELTSLMKSIYDLFKQRSDVSITLKVDEGEFYTLGDINHFRRVLNNLVTNAIQAIPEDKDGVVEMKLWRNSDYHVIQITDNGVGIKEEQHSFIFKPNFTTKNSGTGLGLAISKKIIEQMEGKIYFESEYGQGTVFWVEVPVIKV